MNDGHRKRRRSYNIPGHAHALTFSCFQRRKFLSKDRTRQWFVEALEAARQKLGFHVWAYVVMPEHAHVLIWPTGKNYEMRRILEAIKLPVSRKALAFIRRENPKYLNAMRDEQPNGAVAHRFWQRGGGFDRNVVEPKVVWSEIEYIHGNPIRRGLCERALDWPWSSAADYAGLRQGPVTIDKSSLPFGES
ncbi:MAG: transposase [Planctomycetales bacterium]|jgi:putative transposase|nr:transposase [Planctomycetales bacterium]MBN8626811.1 transposase [Planctomycetota bacterium]